VNTIDGPTKLVRQDAILCGLSIGQLLTPGILCRLTGHCTILSCILYHKATLICPTCLVTIISHCVCIFVVLFLFFLNRSTGHALNILKMDHLEYLGLVSLKKIQNGGSVIGYTSQICYLKDLDLSEIYLTPKQGTRFLNNKPYDQCGKC